MGVSDSPPAPADASTGPVPGESGGGNGGETVRIGGSTTQGGVIISNSDQNDAKVEAVKSSSQDNAGQEGGDHVCSSPQQPVSQLDYPLAPEGPLAVSKCRHCAGRFEYSLDGLTYTVMIGIPAAKSGYNAISYVWGDVQTYRFACGTCGRETQAPFASVAKLHDLLRLGGGVAGFGGAVRGGGGDSATKGTPTPVWLDSLSIHQADDADKARCMAAMGRIYDNAMKVCVLLPAEDVAAFVVLFRLTVAAETVLTYLPAFSQNEDIEVRGKQLSEYCKDYWRLTSEIEDKLGGWSYWSRAWTFQEWTLASDIDVGLEGAFGSRESYVAIASDMPQIDRVPSVKLKAWMAGSGLAKYKLAEGQYAAVSQGFPAAEAATRFEAVKKLFPYADYMLTPDEIDPDEKQFAAAFSAIAASQGKLDLLLGLTNRLGADDDDRKFQRRLRVALNSYAASRRHARFEADLVCCWASMLNIAYDYRKEDSVATALGKVVAKLREKGIKVYNFQPPVAAGTGDTLVDVTFFDYAHEHWQCNVFDRSNFPGAPVFTGIADMVAHLRVAFQQLQQQQQAPPPLQIQGGNPAPLHRVPGASILSVTRLDKFTWETFSLTLSNTVVGVADGFRWHDVLAETWKVVAATPKEVLARLAIVVAKLPIGTTRASYPNYAYAWAVCSAAVCEASASALAVARDDITGTLAVTARQSRNQPATVVIGYLLLTCQQSGCHLFETGADGHVHMELGMREVTGMKIAMVGGRDVARSQVLEAFVPLEPFHVS
ncbi:hypothetical protein HK405_009512 [Cladochytrium tenue]|nr:hypothetical protein HK405_009512 [Cladochytrium tenue]